ncbi:6,7-dimethyl-8-ribityllumazine synthase [Silvibacterium sp.]|uniref:6,7-dimethyl-8-ribityllumazine synthase n=1 Tax=Silvibacterium sp. TaxID=1964179 RepID=UPI0039E472EF
MIKGITAIRPASSPAVFETLVSFFSILGFESGKGWQDETGQGRPFLAPVGNLEFVHGEVPHAAGPADTYIEVTQLDEVRGVIERWIAQHLSPSEGEKRISETVETTWKSRVFTVEPVPGFRYAFWEHTEPLAGKPVALEGDLVATDMKFAIILARWNAVITDRLLQGALDCLYRSGVRKDQVNIIRVPGAWEIPSAARAVAETKLVDGIITLGLLLRGETAHYEAIYNEVSRGIGQSQQETGIPHAFGVLTCETLEQALDRAGLKAGNKGFEAASAAIEMVSLHRKIAQQAAEKVEAK